MFEKLTVGQLALYSTIYPSLVGRYLDLGFPFHGGPKLPATRTEEYQPLLAKIQQFEQQRLGWRATRAEFLASLENRPDDFGVYAFARLIADNAYTQYDYAFRNLR